MRRRLCVRRRLLDLLLVGLPRRLFAEFLGTGLLVAVVVGSGIAAQRLTADVALQLLVNSLATAAGLAVLILVFVPISGAHFNPAVSGECNVRPRGLAVNPCPVVLFACRANAGRSIAARLLAEHYAGALVGTFSAGSEPGAGVHPEVAAGQDLPTVRRFVDDIDQRVRALLIQLLPDLDLLPR
jgi:Major intrinsic protein